MDADPKFNREQAERCRKIAKNTLDRDMKDHLLSVARHYELLAEEAEARLSKQP